MTTPRPDLTPTEHRVLVLVAASRTNPQIREILGLGLYALPRHLNSLYKKSGVHQPGEPYTPLELRHRLAEWGRQYFQEGGGA